MRYAIILFLLVTSPFVEAISLQPNLAVLAEEKTSTWSFPVGELGERWVLPSDHLPVGGTVGNIHFVIWNILSSHALHYIEDNGQGLRDSFIMASNIPADDGLTLREVVIIDQISEMIEHPTHPRSLIALQETSPTVYHKLKQSLPQNMRILPPLTGDLYGDVFIFDANIFTYIDHEYQKYKCSRKNTIATLVLKEKATGLVYCFVQSHVPGGPAANSYPARVELSRAIFDNYTNNYTPFKAIIIVMGDMNRSPDYFLENFAAIAKEREMDQPFKNLWVPYPTHINTHMEASWIDNLFIANPYSTVPCQVAQDASVFFDDLQRTLDLLESFEYRG